MFIHVTASGQQIRIVDLTNDHLNNIIALIEKKAREGIFGYFDSCGREIYLYGSVALNSMNYNEYLKERARRHALYLSTTKEHHGFLVTYKNPKVICPCCGKQMGKQRQEIVKNLNYLNKYE